MAPKLALAWLAVWLAAQPAGRADAATLTRGPYLQCGTPASVVVRWRTLEATDTRIEWGIQAGALTSGLSDPALTTQHEVQITGLGPDTRYWYAIGTSTQLWGDATFTFSTGPVAGTVRPVRAWVIGDSGEPGPVQDAVRDAFMAHTGPRGADLMLMLGDNAYTGGTDDEYQAGMFVPYAAQLRQWVVWPTRGNHDQLHSGADNDYYDFFSLPTNAQAGGLPSGAEAYYSYEYANIHFICLDSEGTSTSATGAMMAWMRADLQATTQDWIIAYWHHPPYSKGSHNSDSDPGLRTLRQNVVPFLDSLGVDLCLTGHSHAYERSFLVRRHYGRSGTLTDSMKVDAGDGRRDGDGPYHKPVDPHAAFAGAVYAVAGSSSKIGGGTLDHPVMVSSQNVPGSLVLDVNGLVLDARFLDSAGAVTDSFTILKVETLSVPGAPAPRSGFAVLGVSPQPSGGAVDLVCVLPVPGRARVVFYDAEGRRVVALAPADRPAGEWRVRWDGRGTDGRRLTAGMYFGVVEFGGERRAARLILTP